MPKPSPYRRRGKDKAPRQMHPASLANLRPVTIPAVLDGKESVAFRFRLSPAEARAVRRMDTEERSRLLQLALQVRENGG